MAQVITMIENNKIEVWGDISDRFELIDEHLVYMDAPLEGYLKVRETGETFAFRCSPIVPGCLWHWVLLPSKSSKLDAKTVFENIWSAPPARWISVVEDRRGETPQLYAAELAWAHQPPR